MEDDQQQELELEPMSGKMFLNGNKITFSVFPTRSLPWVVHDCTPTLFGFIILQGFVTRQSMVVVAISTGQTSLFRKTA